MQESLSLIIPVYNEAGHLKEFVQMIDELNLPVHKELVFIDDGSVDRSADILKNYAFKSTTQVLQNAKNQGKGSAIRLGIQHATGNYIGIQDSDFELDPNDIAELITLLVQGKADVVYGSRFKKSTYQVHRTFHYLGNRFLTFLNNLLSGIYLSDMETCYKFFKAEIIKNVILESDRFGFEPEITAKIARLNLRLMEVPISYAPRTYIQGKKITWKDGVSAIMQIIYYNCMRNPKRFYRETLPELYKPKGASWL
jgi:glycosyltransferase involved in cell wall biosynthesis